MENNFETFAPNYFESDGARLGMNAFDWADVQNKIVEYTGKMTGNPQMIATAQAAQAVKDAVQASTGRTLTTEEASKVREDINAATAKEVSDSLGSFLTKWKWIVIGIILLVVVIKLR